MQIAANTAGTLNNSSSLSRSKSKQKAKKKSNSGVIFAGAFIVLICLVTVLLSAMAANLNQQNNELKKKNDYIQAEIDSLNIKIGDASNIDKIETTATEKYGMVHSESQNCITVGDSKDSGKTNLASAIKDEAYE